MKFEIYRKVLVKSDEETDPRYGCDPEKKEIRDYLANGIVNIDKPCGPTSHQVTSWVKNILNFKKAGHSGTLDPKVTGVLPIAIGNATKIIQALLLSEKEYIGIISLHGDVPDNGLEKIFHYFQGDIFQTPPLKSSVKKELRKKSIYKLKILERENRMVLFDVHCEAGTYIRKLCHDIGIVLGTGAHMHELRRVKVGPFDENSIIKLNDLKDAYEFYLKNGDERYLRKIIQPMEIGVSNLKKIWIKDSAIAAICHGANLNAPGVSKLEVEIQNNELVSLLSLKNELVALGKSLRNSNEIYEMKTGTIVDLERVIMSPDTYPKKWHKAEKIKNI